MVLALSCATAWALTHVAPLGQFQAIATVALSAMFFVIGSMAIYRVALALWPLSLGAIDAPGGSIISHEIHALFHVMLFAPIARCGVLPVPMARLFYLGLGARMGRDSYTVGILHDPCLVTIGDRCLLGMNSQLVAHIIDGRSRAYYPIHLGDRVTIGPNAIVMADVTISDGAIIEAGAVVPRGSRVGTNEVWAGVPARPLTLADLVQRKNLTRAATERAA